MSRLTEQLPELKDLAQQKPGRLIVIAPNGMGTPLYADSLEVADGRYVVFRDKDGEIVVGMPVQEAHVYGAQMQNLITRGEMLKQVRDNEIEMHGFIKSLPKSPAPRTIQTPFGEVQVPDDQGNGHEEKAPETPPAKEPATGQYL